MEHSQVRAWTWQGPAWLWSLSHPEPSCRAQEASPPYHSFPAIVLSMPRSSERRQAMQQRLDKAGAQYTFLDAIDSQQQQEGQVGIAVACLAAQAAVPQLSHRWCSRCGGCGRGCRSSLRSPTT